MIERYTRPEMGAVWTERRKLDAWLQVELAVVDAVHGRPVRNTEASANPEAIDAVARDALAPAQ